MRAVGRCQRKRHSHSSFQKASSANKPLTLAYALKSFVGYLEGTEKSAHTIKNYKSDLVSFQNYLEKGLGSAPVALAEVNYDDLERYHEFLKAEGLKTNTRRRKVLTVRRMLKYLTLRNKLTLDVGRKIPAPQKIERIPLTVSYSDLLQAVRKLPADVEIQARNRALLWTLVETGCLVSEVTPLRFEDWKVLPREQSEIDVPPAYYVTFGGKAARAVPVSSDLYQEIERLRIKAGERQPIFLGFNKFGSLGAPITARGIEMLVKSYAPRLGFEILTPRTFRHTAVIEWFKSGLSRAEIQKRLGLKTDYAFRTYDPVFKSMKKTTSISEKSQPES